MPPRARLGALLLAVLVPLACATTRPRPLHIVEIETPRFDGVHYPTPQALPAVDQPPPSPPEELPVPDDLRLASMAPAAPQPAPPEPQPDWHNAAVRDRETESLARHYLRQVELLYHLVRQLGPASPAGSDALLVRKWHADVIADMGFLIEQAAALEGVFVELAQQLNVDLAGATEAQGRAGRLRLLFRMSACIRRDLSERTRDGLAYLDARRRGIDDADLRPGTPAELERQTEALIRQTTATLTCARLASRVLSRP